MLQYTSDMEVGLFFMPKIHRKVAGHDKTVRKNNNSGGGSCARKNHIGMYRV